MKRYILVVISVLCVALTQAQTSAPELANAAYAAGQYEEAARWYEQSIDSLGEVSDLYFNLGNANYKMGELGKAILNYERALRLDPLNSDAKYNLAIAQEKITDNVADDQSFFLSRWVSLLVRLLPTATWMWISVGLFLVALGMLFLYFFGRSLPARKAGFHTAWIALLLSVCTLLSASAQHRTFTQRSDAIVMRGIVNVKSSPDKSGTDLFVLHEGTKVHINETLGEWAEITVGTNRGWVALGAIERI